MIILAGNSTNNIEKFLLLMGRSVTTQTNNWDKLKNDYGENLKAVVVYENFWDAAQKMTNDRKEAYKIASQLHNEYKRTIKNLNDLQIRHETLLFPNFLFEFKKTGYLLKKLGVELDKSTRETTWKEVIQTCLKNHIYKPNSEIKESFIDHSSHDQMILNQEDAVTLTTLKDKITAIIPTFSAPMNCFMWTMFSYLLNTRPNDALEHIIVCINGADERTGDISLQDKKQAFLEELRDLKWYHEDNPANYKDMPITIIRAWSRIGHPEGVEMALPWVHTDNYIISHDDIIITKEFWIEEIKERFFKNPKAAIAHSNPLLCAFCASAEYQNKNLLRFPHLLCTFLVCKKKLIDALPSRWCGYHIEMPDFKIEELAGDFDKFITNQAKYKENCISTEEPPQKDFIYNYISMEMGAWHFYNLKERNLEFMQIDPNLIVHFGAMSWETEEKKKSRVQGKYQWAEKIEQKILKHPEYSKLFLKYRD